MSWQLYIDNILIPSDQISGACIIDLYGGMLAQTNLPISTVEADAIVKLFNSPMNSETHYVTVAGITFLCIRLDDKIIYARNNNENTSAGVIFSKTNQCIIIGYFDETQQLGEAALVVESLAELIKTNK